MGFRELKRGLLDAGDVLKHASGRALLRAARRRGRQILNAGEDGGGRASADQDATAVAQQLRALGRRLEAAALDDRGRVDYVALRHSEHREALERAASDLRDVDPSSLASDDERIAFWMNVYNVLAIHGVVALEVTRSVMEDPTFFSRVAYRIGELDYTLDEIENGVLRRNGAHPVGNKPLFDEGDPRTATMPSTVDARIHAALVCASASCPAVRFYEPEALDDRLDAASRAYVNGEVDVDDEGRRIVLPLAFRYYGPDFGGERGVLEFVRHHADEHLTRRLDGAKGYRLDYARYDWRLNQS